MNRRHTLVGLSALAATALPATVLTATPARADLAPGLKGPKPRVSPDVIMALNTQAKLWTAGDLDGFCAYYAEQALFLSPSGLTRGRAEVLARYKKKYVEGPEGKAGMGALTFDFEDARGDERFAIVALRWTLVWPDAMKKPKATGLSLVTFEKIGAKWQVVHDASM
jgi:ketosteroid isomerase-like protein